MVWVCLFVTGCYLLCWFWLLHCLFVLRLNLLCRFGLFDSLFCAYVWLSLVVSYVCVALIMRLDYVFPRWVSLFRCECCTFVFDFDSAFGVYVIRCDLCLCLVFGLRAVMCCKVVWMFVVLTKDVALLLMGVLLLIRDCVCILGCLF